jgi:hypothetical protein
VYFAGYIGKPSIIGMKSEFKAIGADQLVCIADLNGCIELGSDLLHELSRFIPRGYSKFHSFYSLFFHFLRTAGKIIMAAKKAIQKAEVTAALVSKGVVLSGSWGTVPFGSGGPRLKSAAVLVSTDNVARWSDSPASGFGTTSELSGAVAEPNATTSA